MSKSEQAEKQATKVRQRLIQCEGVLEQCVGLMASVAGEVSVDKR